MAARIAVVMAGVLAAWPAVAKELKAHDAERLVVGKLFAYTCFDGTTGAGRIFADGSVAGTIRIRGEGPVRYTMFPAGTLRVKSDAVCASLRGLPWEPCFNLEQTDANTFRGSIKGLNFAYCTFTKRNARTSIARATGTPLSLRALAGDARGRN